MVRCLETKLISWYQLNACSTAKLEDLPLQNWTVDKVVGFLNFDLVATLYVCGFTNVGHKLLSSSNCSCSQVEHLVSYVQRKLLFA